MLSGCDAEALAGAAGSGHFVAIEIAPQEGLAVNDNQDPVLAARRRLGRLVAAPGLALVAAVLTLQMLAQPVAALAAGLAAGVVAVALWGRLVVRPEGPSYGRAVGLGIAATFAAVFAAAAVGAGGAPASGREATGVALFALFMALPVMVAASVGLAALLKDRPAR